MTDLETREDDWARGVFDRVRTGQHEPRWIPDASAAARLSGRRRIRYRTTGALAAAAIVGLSATAFTTLGGDAGGDGNSVSAGAGTIAWNGLDLSKYLEIGGTWRSDRKDVRGPLSATGLTTISAVLQSMDPGLKHVRTTSGAHRLDIGPAIPGTSNIQIQATGYWAPNGDISSFPRPATPFRPTTPFGEVTITPMGPQFGQQVNTPDKPCGLGSLAGSSQIPEPTAWAPCQHSRQSDGSDILITHSVGLASGSVTVAERLFPDGSSVRILASTVIGYQQMTSTGPADPPKFISGPSLDPVPWTDAGLKAALSGPDIKGLP